MKKIVFSMMLLVAILILSDSVTAKQNVALNKSTTTSSNLDVDLGWISSFLPESGIIWLKSFLDSESTSESGSNYNVKITFVNYSKHEISVYWFSDGKETRYLTLAPDETREQSTYENHVWRIKIDKKVVATYTATGAYSQLVEIVSSDVDAGAIAGKNEAQQKCESIASGRNESWSGKWSKSDTGCELIKLNTRATAIEEPAPTPVAAATPKASGSCFGQMPGPEKVVIFTGSNYEGDCNYIEYRGRDQQPYPYSIEWKYDKKLFNLDKKSFNSINIGSGVIVTVCTGSGQTGNCREFTDSVPDLSAQGFRTGSINSFKIYTTTPKNYVSPTTPNDDQVTVCSNPDHGGGCRKVGQGDYDFNSLGYQSILIGRNVKVQVYSERNYYGNSRTLSFTGKPQRVSKFYSMRVLSINENRVADKFRPTPTPIPTPVPTPVSTPMPTPLPTPVVSSTPTVTTPRNPIDGPIRVVGKTELGLTVQNQNLSDNTPIILHSGFNNWTMLSNGAIVLKSNPTLGLTVKNQRIADGSEIILHSGYNLWKVLSNGAIVLKDNPAFGITVLNQNLNDNATIILHGGYNTWTKDYTKSNNVSGNTGTTTPPKANHYPPPNSGGSPYVLCGYENQYCSFQGIGTVAYGVNGIFQYKQNVRMGIQCNDANFGFVVEGVEKRCYFKFEREIKRNTTPTETDKFSPPNANFKVCGVEGGICNFRGKGRVAYGYNNKNGRKFLFKQNVNGSIACNNQTFGGDPAPGKEKVCYVQVLN